MEFPIEWVRSRNLIHDGLPVIRRVKLRRFGLKDRSLWSAPCIKHDARIALVLGIAEFQEDRTIRHREDHVVSAAGPEPKSRLVGQGLGA